MNALQAVSTPETRPASPQPAAKEKKHRISKRIRQAIELIVTGECKTIKAAAARSNLHPDYLCRELKKPQIRVFCEQRSRENLAMGTMRASARLVELLDASSEHVSLDASRHTLGIAGIKPAADAQVSVNIDIKAGYVIDLRDERPGDHARVVNATRTDSQPIQELANETG